jgi:glycosyltransferase involved in cell wall biosynthesis
MTIQVLMVHSRDGIGGSVMTGALLAHEGLKSDRWSPVCVCNSRGSVFDFHQRLQLQTVALAEAVKLHYDPDPTDGNRIRRILKRLFLIRAARRYLQSERPDVIHVHDESSALAWGLAARKAGIPLIWHVHQQAPQKTIDWLLRRLAAHIVFVAATNRRRFRNLDKIPHSVIYNGVDLETFYPSEKSADGTVTIGFVSNLVDRKRPEWVIRAAGRLLREGLDLRVIIAGNDFTNGAKVQTLKALVETEGLGERYDFLGYSSNVPEILRQIDILALPSQRDREAFPRIIIEAMACGIPVVATYVAGIPEAVNNGETGSLVDADDFDGFAAAIRALVRDPGLRRRYGACAVSRAKELFSLDSSVQAVDHLYQELIQRQEHSG